MGRLSSDDMADQVGEDLIDPDTALDWHLKRNHYPPPRIPQVTAMICKHAIREWDAHGPNTPIQLPDGVTTEDGRRIVLASEEVSGWHLYSFIGHGYFADAPDCADAAREWLVWLKAEVKRLEAEQERTHE